MLLVDDVTPLLQLYEYVVPVPVIAICAEPLLCPLQATSTIVVDCMLGEPGGLLTVAVEIVVQPLLSVTETV